MPRSMMGSAAESGVNGTSATAIHAKRRKDYRNEDNDGSSAIASYRKDVLAHDARKQRLQYF